MVTRDRVVSSMRTLMPIHSGIVSAHICGLIPECDLVTLASYPDPTVATPPFLAIQISEKWQSYVLSNRGPDNQESTVRVWYALFLAYPPVDQSLTFPRKSV